MSRDSRIKKKGYEAYFPNANDWDRAQLNPYADSTNTTAKNDILLWVGGWDEAEQNYGLEGESDEPVLVCPHCGEVIEYAE